MKLPKGVPAGVWIVLGGVAMYALLLALGAPGAVAYLPVLGVWLFLCVLEWRQVQRATRAARRYERQARAYARYSRWLTKHAAVLSVREAIVEGKRNRDRVH